MPMFGAVYSKSRFSRRLVNCQFDCCLVLRAGPTEIRNQKLRPPKDLFRCHELNGGLRNSKRAFVRNHVSQGKLDRLDLHEFSIICDSGLRFGNRAYPWTSIDE